MENNKPKEQIKAAGYYVDGKKMYGPRGAADSTPAGRN